jgi:nicotinamide-nucleotide amidase
MEELAKQVGAFLKEKNWQLVAAESCTGGGLGEQITAIAGSSAWFDRGFITYSNASKIDMLGVNLKTLETYGAVSEETVLEMARGALQRSQAQLGVSISGIAGPDGGSSDKPVGTVWIAWAGKQTQQARKYAFKGDRHAVRLQAINAALKGILTSGNL